MGRLAGRLPEPPLEAISSSLDNNFHGLSTVKRKACQERGAVGQEDRVTLWIIEASTP